MKKVIREVDQKRGILQVTVADERWYMKAGKDPETGMPVYTGVPSVTWIAGFYPKGIEFYKWLAETGWDEAEQIKRDAGDKGSVVHLAIEKILNGEEFRIDTKVEDKSRGTEQEMYERELTYEELLCVASFCDWRKDLEKKGTPLEVLATEITIMSEIHGYAGTVDLVCRIGGVPYIVDFKTSKRVQDSHELQISAYRVALENGENPLHEKNPNGTEGKMLDLSGMKTAILQVGYTKNKSFYKFTETEDRFEDFKEVAMRVWRKTAGTQSPTVKDFPIVLSPAVKKPGDGSAEGVIGPEAGQGETEPAGSQAEPTFELKAPEAVAPSPSKAPKKNGKN